LNSKRIGSLKMTSTDLESQILRQVEFYFSDSNFFERQVSSSSSCSK